MDDVDEIEFTVQTLQEVRTNEKHRLAVGTELRRYIHSQLEKGVEPDHYRMHWMNQGISHVIHALELYGREFNATHPRDKFSTGDMIDIVESAALTLRNYISQNTEHEGGI